MALDSLRGVCTSISKYFRSDQLKYDAYWVGLALSVALLAFSIVQIIVGLNIPSSDSRGIPGSMDLHAKGMGAIIFGAGIGGVIALTGIVGTALGIYLNRKRGEVKLREQVIRRVLIISAIALFVFGVALARVAANFQEADSRQYYTVEHYNQLQSVLGALKTTGITFSVFGAIAVGATTLGLEGLTALACYIKNKFTVRAQTAAMQAHRPDAPATSDTL